MNARDFRQQVLEQERQEVSQECLEEAVDYHIEQGWTRQEHLRTCVQLARRFQVWRAPSPSSDRRRMRVTPALVHRSDQLAAWIRPAVEQLRQELFGSTTAPFSSLTAAANWIERMATTSVFPEEMRQQIRARARDILRQITAFQALGQGHELPVWFQRHLRTVSYVKPGEGLVQTRALTIGSPLESLERMCRQSSEATGFQSHALVAYILVDTPPLLPNWRMELQSYIGNLSYAGDFSRRQVTVTFLHGDVTYDDMQHLRRQIREAFGRTNTAALSEKDIAFLRLVEELGGPPSRGNGLMAFWDRVAKECNRRLGTRYKHGRGPCARYERLQVKLAPQGRAPLTDFFNALNQSPTPPDVLDVV